MDSAPPHMNNELPAFAVEIENLTKVYTRRAGSMIKALDNIELKVRRGSVFGLLGPNGAGKSTLINILAGLAIKTSGTARIWGFDIKTQMRRARSAIGVVPQEVNLDAFFCPREVLELQAGLYGVPKKERRTMEILEAVGLADKADAYARSLSGGMKRRLLIAKALVHTPPVVVLDEPTAGVDVELRRQLWAYMRELNKSGTTILVTTHYLEEAEEMCDTIAIIDHGKLIACDTTPALINRLDQRTLTITTNEYIEKVPDILTQLSAILTAPNKLIFSYSPSVTQVGDILAGIQAANLTVADLTTTDADLEDVFLRLTGIDEKENHKTTIDPPSGAISIARSTPQF